MKWIGLARCGLVLNIHVTPNSNFARPMLSTYPNLSNPT